MIRVLVEKLFADGLKYIEAAGLAADEKPAGGIVTGSLFLEADTGDIYAFAEGDAPGWNKIAALGGGE